MLSEAGAKPSEQFDRLYQILYATLARISSRRRSLRNSWISRKKSFGRSCRAVDLPVTLPVGLRREAAPSTDPVRLAGVRRPTHSLVAANEFVYRY